MGSIIDKFDCPFIYLMKSLVYLNILISVTFF